MYICTVVQLNGNFTLLLKNHQFSVFQILYSSNSYFLFEHFAYKEHSEKNECKYLKIQ